MPRFVNRTFHDEAYEGMPKTMQQIYDEKLYDTITICNRAGEVVFSTDVAQHKDGVDVAVVLKKERDKPWSQKRYEKYIEVSDALLQSMEARGEEALYIDDVKGLQAEAKSMVNSGKFSQVEKETQALLERNTAQETAITVNISLPKSLKSGEGR